jgi:chorismate synthase
MASNSFGNVLRFTTFGESHGPAIGVIVDGVPAGVPLDEALVQEDLDKRRPGQSRVTTPRKESDTVRILSGVFEGVTTGHPVGMLIHNSDADSTQYDNIKGLFRPGHADYSWFAKYGIRDHRGSGRASARETACRVAAGAVAKQILRPQGVLITAGGIQVGDIRAAVFDPEAVYANPVRSADPGVAAAMEALILKLAEEKDSVGGVVECRVAGLPAGLGEPVYHKLDAELAAAIMGLGAVKGIEFGTGFAAAALRGSENNDPLGPDGFLSNNAGGVLGGVSTGQELVFRAAVKPTSSIARTQHSLGTDGQPVEFAIDGRHDPCLVPRIVPVIEAMTAFVLADLLLMNRLSRI